MKIELFVTGILLLTCFFASAQQTLPIIKATSKTVSIRDGNILQKNSWTISPELKPDVHKTSSNRVTFITDRDSITFKIKHDKVYNFVILLNNKDSAFTQIKYVPTFLDVLKKADKYNYLDNREILKFRYQIKDDPELKAISQKFKLDSIAGTGNEISQLLNVLHWVHNT